MVRRLDRVDAVDLDEPEPADQRQQVRVARRTDRPFPQRVTIGKDASYDAVANARVAHRDARACREKFRMQADVSIGILDL